MTRVRNIKERMHFLRFLFGLYGHETLVYMFIYYHTTANKEYTIHVMQRKNFEVFPFSVCPLTNLGPNSLKIPR